MFPSSPYTKENEDVSVSSLPDFETTRGQPTPIAAPSSAAQNKGASSCAAESQGESAAATTTDQWGQLKHGDQEASTPTTDCLPAAASVTATAAAAPSVSSFAAAAVTAVTAAAGAGFFGRVPASLLHVFIGSQPEASQAALFATSKWLATRVLAAAPQVTLRLIDTRELTAEQTEMRRSIITQMLSVRQQGFAVELWSAPWQPFPVLLTGRIVLLDATPGLPWDRGVYPASTCFVWSAMANLCTLRIQDVSDIIGVCEAVGAGHLQQLCNLDITRCSDLPDVDCFIGTVAQQLEYVAVAEPVATPFLARAHELKRLRDLKIHLCTLTDDMMQQVCSHPTLRHLRLSICTCQGDHSQRSCSFTTLTVFGTNTRDVLLLPLASVQQVFVLGQMYNHVRQPEVEGTPSPLLHKVVCQPLTLNQPPDRILRCYGSRFRLVRPCESMIPLVKGMQGVETVRVENDCRDPSVLNRIWQALPMSVCYVILRYLSVHSWAHLWQGLPQHVVQFTLDLCVISAEDLHSLVRSTPTHVKTMVIEPHPFYLYRRELKDPAAREAFAKRLCAAAPKHLQVEVPW